MLATKTRNVGAVTRVASASGFSFVWYPTQPIANFDVIVHVPVTTNAFCNGHTVLVIKLGAGRGLSCSSCVLVIASYSSLPALSCSDIAVATGNQAINDIHGNMQQVQGYHRQVVKNRLDRQKNQTGTPATNRTSVRRESLSFPAHTGHTNTR
jgi:hypothetical protein